MTVTSQPVARLIWLLSVPCPSGRQKSAFCHHFMRLPHSVGFCGQLLGLETLAILGSKIYGRPPSTRADLPPRCQCDGAAIKFLTLDFGWCQTPEGSGRGRFRMTTVKATDARRLP